MDIDISGILHDKILVERTHFSFYVGIDYEKLSKFCNFCKNVNHVIGEFKKHKTTVEHKAEKVENCKGYKHNKPIMIRDEDNYAHKRNMEEEENNEVVNNHGVHHINGHTEENYHQLNNIIKEVVQSDVVL